jgi:hypothetical protein
MAGDHGSTAQEMAKKLEKFKMPCVPESGLPAPTPVPFQVSSAGML